jgi:ribosomal protein S18 acetylase RimI-like enzyme
VTRVATAAEAGEVAALLDAFQREYDEFTPGAEALVPRVVRHIEQDLSLFLLAGPADVGVAQLRFREYLLTGEPAAYLEELYVVPARRGEGHGRALIERAFEESRARGCTFIELGTAVSDTAARGLYESAGFTNLERPGDPSSSMLVYEREL